jgi:hypothetical protein
VRWKRTVTPVGDIYVHARPAANNFPSLIIAMGFTGQLLRITLSISRFLYVRVCVCANPAPEEVFIGWKLAALWLSAAEDSNAWTMEN